jgi:hypothetical protein
MTSLLAKVGVVVMMDTWPYWERGRGIPEPHPALILKRFDNGLCLLVPITHSRYLCTAFVEINNEDFTEAHKPVGPLDKSGVSYLCLKDELGYNAAIKGDPTASGYVVVGYGNIGASRAVDISANSKWGALMAEIRAKFR